MEDHNKDTIAESPDIIHISSLTEEDINKNYSGRRFRGVVCNNQAGLGFFRSKAFRGDIAGHSSNLLKGDMEVGASVEFSIGFDCEKNRPIAVDIESDYIHQVPEKGVFVKTIHEPVTTEREKLKEAFKSGLPAIVYRLEYSNAPIERQQKFLQRVLRGATDADEDQIFNIYELASDYSPDFLEKIIDKNILECFNVSYVAFEQKPVGNYKKVLHRIFSDLSKLLFEEINQKAWTILVDETGSCNDYMDHDRKLPPSVMMALIVPPKTQIPAAAYGFHSMITSHQPEADRIRKTIVDNENMAVFAMPYESGAPPKNLSPGHIFTDFHAQLWRAILPVCLEFIAQQEALQGRSEPADVKIYFEQVAQITPHESRLFDGDIARLVETLSKERTGWGNIKPSTVSIVPKDFHPWLGYVDALGFVFRSIWTPVKYSDELKNRKKTFMIPYSQTSHHEFERVLFASGSNPMEAIKLLSAISPKTLNNYCCLLDQLTTDCLSRLGMRDYHELMENMREHLSRFPDRYEASDFICSRIPRDWLNTAPDSEIRVLVRLNQLASKNHRGDTESEEANEIVTDLKRLEPDIVIPESRLRLQALLGDYWVNQLDFGTALERIEKALPEARELLPSVRTAAHFFGHAAGVLALSGKTKRAEALLNEVFEYHTDPSDIERHFIYLTHLDMDLERFENAIKNLREAVVNGPHGPTATIQDACKFSPFLLHAALKLQALCPFLENDDLVSILKIEPGSGFPWGNIAYWRRHCAQQTPNLKWMTCIENSLSNTTAQCAALRLINTCLALQFRDDGVDLPDGLISSLEGLTSEDNFIAAWLQEHPPQAKDRYGFLRPLFFNWK